MKQTKKNYWISQLAIGILAMLLLTVIPAVALGQGAIDPQLARRVRRELVTLPYYGVFDNLEYSINGGTVTLSGQVVRPITRSDAEGRVKRIKGVSRVVNNIEVLPLSRFDDDIRRATLRSVAQHGRTLSIPAGNESVAAHNRSARTRDTRRCCFRQW